VYIATVGGVCLFAEKTSPCDTDLTSRTAGLSDRRLAVWFISGRRVRGGAGTLQQLLALAASGRVRTKLSRRRPVNNLCYQYVYVRDINCRISTAADACETSSATFCEDNCVRSGLVANLASRRRSTRVHSEKRRPPPKTSTYACVWNYTPVESHSLL